MKIDLDGNFRLMNVKDIDFSFGEGVWEVELSPLTNFRRYFSHSSLNNPYQRCCCCQSSSSFSTEYCAKNRFVELLSGRRRNVLCYLVINNSSVDQYFLKIKSK